MLSQQAYAEKVLARFDMSSANPSRTPELLDNEVEWHDAEQSVADAGLFRAIVGSLMYLATSTRPDIAHAVQRLTRQMHDPRVPHMTGAKRVLRYLRGTISHGIAFDRVQMSLIGYCDASWASKPDRRSTSGILWLVGNGPVVWRSLRQRITALSSCESEYIAAAEAVREWLWLAGFLEELGLGQGASVLYCDNMSAIATAKSTSVKERTKHIDVRHHFLREVVQSKALRLEHVPTTKQLADSLTKIASQQSLDRFVQRAMATAQSIHQ